MDRNFSISFKAQARSARAMKTRKEKKRGSITSLRTEQARLIRCFLYGFVEYSGKGTNSFEVLTELEVRTATYGPEIDQLQHVK